MILLPTYIVIIMAFALLTLGFCGGMILIVWKFDVYKKEAE
jgi:nitrate reductase NapE component